MFLKICIVAFHCFPSYFVLQSENTKSLHVVALRYTAVFWEHVVYNGLLRQYYNYRPPSSMAFLIVY